MKRVLAIATLLLAAGSAVPVQAVSPHSRTTPNQNFGLFESEGTVLANDFDDYRRYRHQQLEHQMRQELSQPKYRYMSQSEKERVMRQAHDNLEDALKRQEKEWNREQDRWDDRYDRYDNRYDRYDNRYDRYDNRYDRYDNRYRYERSRYNERYNNRWD